MPFGLCPHCVMDFIQRTVPFVPVVIAGITCLRWRRAK